MNEPAPHADVLIYSSPFCGYCSAAKRLLADKGVEFTEIDVLREPARREEMTARSGRRTVPQIFVDGRHVGGFSELRALEEDGRLQALLSGDGPDT